MTQSNTTLATVPVDTGKVPREGAKAIAVSYDFSAGTASYTTDMQLIKQQGKISLIQSVMIDNSNNTQPVVLTVANIGQQISIPASFQGIFPIFVTDQPVFTVTSTGSGIAKIYFSNAPQAPFMWQAIAIPLNVGGTLAVSDAILDATVSSNRVNTSSHPAPATMSDHSGTITTGGTSQQAIAGTPNRVGYMIQNLDAGENLYVNMGTAAAIDTPGTWLIPPYGSIQGVGTGAINVIATTAGHKFTAKDWT